VSECDISVSDRDCLVICPVCSSAAVCLGAHLSFDVTLAEWHIASIVWYINKVTLRSLRLVLGWVTILAGYTVLVRNHMTRSAQPCIPLGLLNRVPALMGKDRNVTSAGWQITLLDPIWHMSSHSSEASCKLLYSVYLLYVVSSLCVC